MIETGSRSARGRATWVGVALGVLLIATAPLVGYAPASARAVEQPVESLARTSEQTSVTPVRTIRVDPRQRGDVVRQAQEYFWSAMDVPAKWTGSVSGCRPGSISSKAKTATLNAVNYARALAGLKPVRLDNTAGTQAQAAALIIEATRELNHYPPESTRCWSRAGSTGSSRSNLAYWTPSLTPGRAVELYLNDPGPNNAAAGHRRWLLMPNLASIGVGNTQIGNALHVIDETWQTEGDWVLWPSAGYFPRELLPLQECTASWYPDYPCRSVPTFGRFTVGLPLGNFDKAKASVRVKETGERLRILSYDRGSRTGVDAVSFDVAIPDSLKSAVTTGRDSVTLAITVTGVRTKSGSVVTQSYTSTLILTR